LHHDYPLSDVEITYTLSGPTQIVGKIEPENRDLADVGIYPWGTWLIPELDGEIMAPPCIILPSSITQEELRIEAVGFTQYAQRQRLRDKFELGSPTVGIDLDPLDIVRYLWDYIQGAPARDLGVVVDDTKTTVKLGTPKVESNPDSGPYTLSWWESPNIGQEIDRLAKETPFDYRERAEWKPDKSGPALHLDLGFPRIGRRRFDLRFAQGENIDDLQPIEEDPELFASTVIVHGRGEGSEMVQGRADAEHPYTLPITTVIEDKTLTTKEACNKRASDELQRRSLTAESRLQINEVTLDIYNQHAPLGSFDVGDEILIHANLAYIGEVALWHRITSMTLNINEETMKLSLVRSGLELQNFDPGFAAPLPSTWALGVVGSSELGETTTLA